MKPAPFDYIRADAIEQICALLAEEARECRMIAGGQSLVPMMAMRLTRPELLIDIAQVDELRGISSTPQAVAIKACTRQVEIERSSEVAISVPLLAAALPWIGHVQTRNRGTIGGSLAHADPTAEMALVAAALEAEVVLRHQDGERVLAISDFLLGPLESAIEPNEMLVEVRFPHLPSSVRIGCAVEEVSARDGDFAIVSAAAQVALDAAGICRGIWLASGGASPVPRKPSAVEAALLGGDLSDDAIDQACRAADEILDPSGDVQASAAYRRRVAPGLLARTLRTARNQALAGAV